MEIGKKDRRSEEREGDMKAREGVGRRRHANESIKEEWRKGMMGRGRMKGEGKPRT